MIFLYFLGLSVFLGSRMSHFVFGGDSAEFSLVARTMSVAHAPGYPFFSVLANLANRLIPFYTTPWRVALISVLSTVAASYILYRLLVSLKVSRLSALLGATLYVFLFPVWQYSEIPEVFALSNAIVITVTYLLFRYKKNGRKMLLYPVALLLGLAVAHHHIFVLFVPAWLYLMYPERGRLIKLPLKDKLGLAFLGLLGASFYLYAVLASRGNPPLDWENAQTLDGLFRLVSRATYGTFKAYTGSSGNILNQLFDVFSFLVFILQDFRLIGLVFIGLGFAGMRKDRRLLVFVLILLGFHVFFLFYTNFVLLASFTLAMYERFLIPIYLILIIPFAYGLDVFFGAFRAFVSRALTNKSLKRVANSAGYAFACGYVAVVMLQNYQVIRKIPQMDYFAVYAKNLLDTPPKNAVFFVGADNSYFTSAYYRFGLNYRPDLKFVFVNMLEKAPYRDRLRKAYPELYVPKEYKKGTDLAVFLRKNAKIGIYFDNPLAATSWKPYGLLWKYYPSETAAASDSANLVKANENLWNHVYTIPGLDEQDRKILHLNVVKDHYLEAYISYSKLLFATSHVDKARQVIEDLIANYRKNNPKDAMVLVNLLVYQKKCEEAGKYAGTMGMETLSQYPELTLSLKSYYDECDSKNPLAQKIRDMVKKQKQEEKSPLDEF